MGVIEVMCVIIIYTLTHTNEEYRWLPVHGEVVFVAHVLLQLLQAPHAAINVLSVVGHMTLRRSKEGDWCGESSVKGDLQARGRYHN